jgi:molecular chaperone GrpE
MSQSKKVHEKTKEKHKKEKILKIEAGEHQKLKEKAKLADQRLEELQRLQAEFENTKKRLEKERTEFIKFANSELISKLLPVLDNFRRALDNKDQNHKAEDVLAGVKLIEKQLEEALKEFGLEPIEAKDKKFDPHYHEAILHEETDKFEDGVVVEEFQKGYLLNDRLLRPSVVKVSKKPNETS